MPESPPADEPRVRHSRNILKYLFSAALTVAFLYLAFRGTDFGRLLESMKSAHFGWLALHFVILMASHMARAWRWRYLLEPLKPRIPLRNLFSGVMVGYMMNNVLPRAGELARPYTIGKLEGISKTSAFGTIVVERIIDTMSFVTLVVIIPIIYKGHLRESFPWLERAGVVSIAVIMPLLACLVVLMLRRDWTDIILRVCSRVVPARFARRVEIYVHSFLDGFLFLKSPGNFLIIFFLSVLIWFLYAVMTYVALFAFSLQGILGFSGAVVVLGISSLGVAIPTPGGTGSYHAFTSMTLVRLFAIEGPTALAYATLTHAIGFIGVTIVGIYYFLKDGISLSAAVKRSGSDPP